MLQTRPLSLTVIILTYNEEIHIERCIRSVSGFARTIYVIDSFSTDRTVEIATRLGAEVRQHPFKHQADQFQWGLDYLPIDTDWIMRVDADEYVTTELAQALTGHLPLVSASVAGFSVDRVVVFLGRQIRHGGLSPQRVLKVWRRGRGRIEQRWMDEHAVVDRGEIVHCPGYLVDENLRDLTWWIDKHNRYATREMIEQLDRELGFNLAQLEPVSKRASRHIAVGFAKNHLYSLFPLFVRTFLYFLYRYVGRLGFLDGCEGLVFHVLQGFWYRFLVDAKLREARRMIASRGIDAFLAHLRETQRFELQPKSQR